MGAERLFNVFTLVFAMVTFSSLISSITNATTCIRNLRDQELKQQSLLQRFLADNGISATLTVRIMGFLAHAREGRRRNHEQDVPLLAMLSKRLRSDLQVEVHGPTLTVHPFFLQLHLFYPSTMRELYHSALEEIHVPVKSEVFEAGD